MAEKLVESLGASKEYVEASIPPEEGHDEVLPKEISNRRVKSRGQGLLC